MKKTVMPKQSAPVERLSSATAGAAGAEKVPLVCPSGIWAKYGAPFAGDDAE